VFESRMLSGRIFEPKRDEMVGDREKRNNKKLHKFYFSPNIIRVSKSIKRRTCNVARMGKIRNASKM
jgi:hypothetical protein